MKINMIHFDRLLILFEGITATCTIWLLHHISLWFLFDTTKMQEHILDYLVYSEQMIKIASTVLITYWTYRGIKKTVKKREN